MDLITGIPRSPNDLLGGIAMLPRTIDKARALIAGTIGEYVYGDKSSFDKDLLDFLGVSSADFLEAVRNSPDDAAVLAWVQAHGRNPSPAEIKAFTAGFQSDGDDDEDRARFAIRRGELPPHIQPKVKGWADLLDAREGRIS
ncbi:MAG TPA: DUF5069 domain-containing protein [Candidatus Eremiobacteraceae bacterium]|nr:DUF5069 domain-containing protein [Candidatus Eremiobacteraceae bacterium]